MIYQATAGQGIAIFNDSQTPDELYNESTFGIPPAIYVYNAKFSAIAVTVDKEIIISDSIAISPDYFMRYNVGQPGKVTV